MLQKGSIDGINLRMYLLPELRYGRGKFFYKNYPELEKEVLENFLT
jgi:hypothetical protein